jgi:fermentation-respiration switch protein FrsA (DUF1100 family)
MRVLLLHGSDSAPGGAKADFLVAKGCTLVNPALPKASWEESLCLAQDAFDRERPDVVVGSSRGGALAMNLRSGDVRLVLIAPAWRMFGDTTSAKQGTLVLHSSADDVVPLADSRYLVVRSGLPASSLVVVGADHRMRDAAALDALWAAVAGRAA